jgi:glyoxylase-like metal-dependent hydrolase (beta-lactamase superfamily II)
MNIGTYRLHAIETGQFGLDGGAMFGVVPKPLWEKTNPPDDRNRIAMAARALLLAGDGRIILVDTGNGSKYNDKTRAIYAMDESQSDLLSSLRAVGVAPDDVTDVILTHLHFDHAGGATQRRNGTVVPTFPRARHHVQREHWEAALHPTERDRASFLADDFIPLQEAGLLHLVDGEQEILPGVRVVVVHGHTTALQCPLIADGSTTLLYCADLIPMAPHVNLPWIMGYDLRPLVTLEEKRQYLTIAAQGKWVLFLEHDPAVAAVTVARGEKGFMVERTVPIP